jgi:Ran GTPase-activating protein (RanGAP) involved in mRNA processing and transport
VNKNLVKLDLSNNAMKPAVARYIIDALMNNSSVTELDLSGNLLDNEFAVDLSYLLEENEVLYKVDISKNPIGPEGAKYLLKSLLQKNDTLGCLGDLSENVYMGVRVREELNNTLRLNNESHGKKKAFLEQTHKGNAKNFLDANKVGEDDSAPTQTPGSI